MRGLITSRAKFIYYQAVPVREDGFSLPNSKELLSQIANQVNTKVFGHLLSEPDIKLVIDNNGPHKRLRLIIGINKKHRSLNIKKLFSGINPQIELKEILLSDLDGRRSSYYLTKHYGYSLPSAKLLSSASNVLSSKSSSIRLEITLKTSNLIKASYLRKKLLSGQKPKLFASYGSQLIKKTIWLAVLSIVKFLQAIKYLLEEALSSTSPGSSKHKEYVSFIDQNESIKLLDKLYDNLWLAKIETVVKSPNPKVAASIDRELEMILKSASSRSSQRLKRRNRYTFSGNNIFSSSELAGLFYLPKSKQDKNIFYTTSFKHLAAPRELVQPSSGAVTLGDNIYGSEISSIRLSKAMRSRHTFILGATGSGKSTLLSNVISADLASGQGISLIDPHGDLALGMLESIPKERLKDVIYFNPADIDHPVGLNLLEIKSKPGSAEYRLELDLAVEGVISLFRKLFSEDAVSGGHRIEYLIRNSVYSAMVMDNPTIFTVYKILTNKSYRNKVISKLNNPDLINFWQEEIGNAGDYQRVKMASGITSKVGRLLSSAASRRVFGQYKSTIDFEDILNSKKILVCNFSKGQLGEDLSRVLGISVLTKLQLAALKRSTIPVSQRRAHYVYIDEFQNFATPAVTQMLSESRKYGVSLTLANQSISQLEPKIAAEILANVGNLIVFRTPLSSDEKQLIDVFKPYLDIGDLINLPAFTCYLKCTGLDNIPPVSLNIRYPQRKVISSQKEVIKSSRKAYTLKLKPAG